MVALPPTPLKPPSSGDTKSSSKSSSESPLEDSVSTQILPLHRLSASSLPPVQVTQAAHSALAQQVLTRNKPVAEVSPFSNNKVSSAASLRLGDTKCFFPCRMRMIKRTVPDLTTLTEVTREFPTTVSTLRQAV